MSLSVPIVRVSLSVPIVLPAAPLSFLTRKMSVDAVRVMMAGREETAAAAAVEVEGRQDEAATAVLAAANACCCRVERHTNYWHRQRHTN